MPAKDKLRKAIEEYDREHARLHKLTGQPLVPARANVEPRLVCRRCWHVVDRHHEYQLWEMKTVAECPCPKGERYVASKHGWRHWLSGRGWKEHVWPGIIVCPKCGGFLDEVQA